MPKSQIPTIKLVVGLGNPGAQYAYTRHSIGLAVLNAYAADKNISYWKQSSGCELAQAGEVLLARPLTYMNTVGGPISKLARSHKISPAEILVIHDEIDLAPGTTLAKVGGGLNGHNGLRSCADKLMSRDFCRLRVGVGRPAQKSQVANYVLKELKGQARIDFEVDTARAADTLDRLLLGDKSVWTSLNPSS